MATAGAGLAWPVYRSFLVDLQFRYGHIFADGGGIKGTRAGVGLGVRF